MIEITEASPTQLPVVRAIAHDTWPHTFGSILSARQIDYMLDGMYSLASLEQQMTQAGHVFLLAWDTVQEIYLGYASYELHYRQTPQTKIHKLYVLPASQGQGVGQQLIQAVRQRALQAGDHTLTLNVNRSNKAVAFYQKLGFGIVRTENISIGEGFWMEDYVMEKPLAADSP